jgi:hypothetical protein
LGCGEVFSHPRRSQNIKHRSAEMRRGAEFAPRRL